VSALASAGSVENLIVLERAKHRPHEVGSVRWAGSTFGPMQKSRLGEHEFEALMRMLDNLGYRTGYTYRYPFVQEKSKPKSDVLIPATVTAFVFEEEAAPVPALRQHAQKQQKEKTRWLNTPNTYMRVNVAEEQQGSAGSQKTKTTWLKADEVEKGSSGTPIRIENPNQFVPLYTDPQEVLEMRNKVRARSESPRRLSDAGAGVSADPRAPPAKSPPASPPQSPTAAPAESPAPTPAEPSEGEWAGERPGSPAERRRGAGHRRGDEGGSSRQEDTERPPVALRGGRGRPRPPPNAPTGAIFPLLYPPLGRKFVIYKPRRVSGRGERAVGARVASGFLIVSHGVCLSVSTTPPFLFPPRPPAVVNGKDEEQSTEESLGKGGGRTTSPANADPDAPKEKETVTSSPVSPEGSPSKSPSKKKKKFRTPSFLKKGKKKEKIES
ncbi:ADDB protein, partial [Balaeniceps rex]|nr:ADDB protein [Balaeniceps rex]